jgi:hypothetical protein
VPWLAAGEGPGLHGRLLYCCCCCRLAKGALAFEARSLAFWRETCIRKTRDQWRRRRNTRRIRCDVVAKLDVVVKRGRMEEGGRFERVTLRCNCSDLFTCIVIYNHSRLMIHIHNLDCELQDLRAESTAQSGQPVSVITSTPPPPNKVLDFSEGPGCLTHDLRSQSGSVAQGPPPCPSSLLTSGQSVLVDLISNH